VFALSLSPSPLLPPPSSLLPPPSSLLPPPSSLPSTSLTHSLAFSLPPSLSFSCSWSP
jgi:hypothetical protein